MQLLHVLVDPSVRPWLLVAFAVALPLVACYLSGDMARYAPFHPVLTVLVVAAPVVLGYVVAGALLIGDVFDGWMLARLLAFTVYIQATTIVPIARWRHNRSMTACQV